MAVDVEAGIEKVVVCRERNMEVAQQNQVEEEREKRRQRRRRILGTIVNMHLFSSSSCASEGRWLADWQEQTRGKGRH